MAQLTEAYLKKMIRQVLNEAGGFGRRSGIETGSTYKRIKQKIEKGGAITLTPSEKKALIEILDEYIQDKGVGIEGPDFGY